MKDMIDPTHIDASLLRVADENPRSQETVDEEKVAELAANIRVHGVLTPIIAYQSGDHYHAVAGGRRTRALKRMVDEGTIAPDYQVLVTLIEKARAREVGIAEQVTHQKLTDIDELRIYAHDDYKNRTDAELAALLGKSEKAVKQRRAVLSLPDFALEATFSGDITVDQAHGLTYFMGDDDTIAELVDDCKHNSQLTLGRLRGIFERQCCAWSKSAMTKLVSKEEYLEAGGELQTDLFADETFILTPQVLKVLAEAKAQSTLEEQEPGWGFIRSEGTGPSGYVPRHPGVDRLTDEERDEWHGMCFSRWEHDEDEEPEWFNRYEELDAKSETFYPEELKALLGIEWRIVNFGEDPISKVYGILPDDLEPLYEAGWLDRPEEEPEEGAEGEGPPEPEGPQLPAALADDIRRIKLHVARQELIKKPNDVVQLYLQHVNTDYSMAFDVRPQPRFQPPLVEVSNSKQFNEALAMDATHPDEIPALSAADQRKLLALKMLKCMTTAIDLMPFEDKVAGYFRPDADFLKRYKKPLLVQMTIEAFDTTEDKIRTQKVSELSENLGDFAASHPDWLPVGFRSDTNSEHP